MLLPPFTLRPLLRCTLRCTGGGARPLLAAALQVGLDAAVVTHAKLTAIHLVQGGLGMQHARAAEELVPISGRVRWVAQHPRLVVHGIVCVCARMRLRWGRPRSGRVCVCDVVAG